MEPLQTPLFHEDIYAAIQTAVMALGGSKKVGAALWPDKPADKAGELLNNCINRTRPEKLDPEQVLYIAREARKAGCHAIADFTAADTGYKYIPIEPEDEKAELQRQVVSASQVLSDVISRLERLSS